MQPLVGIFVGGSGTRMGTLAKGFLRAPASEQTLLERLHSVVRLALPKAPLVLVGRHPAYAGIAIEQLLDACAYPGPLGGLLTLSRNAEHYACSDVIALPCDMPYLEPPLLERLAQHAPGANAVAPVVDARWQPFFARYSTEATSAAIEAQAPSAGSLQRILTTLGAEKLPLTASEARQLRDWDTPEDIEQCTR